MKKTPIILVPVDFTPHTKKLVDYAVQLANNLNAGVQLIHVIEPFSSVDMLLDEDTIDEIIQNLLVKAQEKINDLLTSCKDIKNECGGTVQVGDVVDEIVQYSEEINADMLVIGTHGTKGLEKVLMGSIAERLVKNASCPTLVLNPLKYYLKRWHEEEEI